MQLRPRNGRLRVPVALAPLAWATLSRAWRATSLPARQLQLVEGQLATWRTGSSIREFDSISEFIKFTKPHSDRILEVGCSSGYYSQVIKHMRPSMRYVGIDYSFDFCELGRTRFESNGLVCGNALQLPFRDRDFPIVMSGSVLLHIRDWKAALVETLRLSSEYVILHRTPVLDARTRTVTKKAYGQRMVEWAFQETDLVEECMADGFSLVHTIDLASRQELSRDAHAPNTRSYLLLRA